MSTDAWRDQVHRQHAADLAAGKHDEQCEWRPAGYFLCHCSKRRRESAGFTEPPGELEWQYPLCPRCGETVDGDQDGFQCHNCCVSWSHRPDDTGTFSDDYGALDPTPYDPGTAGAPLGDVAKCPRCGQQARSYSRGCPNCGFGVAIPREDTDEH